jgi:hypothetical protein
MARHLRWNWLHRIKAVEREFLVARKAIDEFIAAVDQGESSLPANTKVNDADAMLANLEGTYLIRLYAAFEAGLRSYYASIREKSPQTTDLINSVAARRQIPDDLRDKVHEVREYRNNLVHEGDEDISAVAIGNARSRLCTFFSWLPDDWAS